MATLAFWMTALVTALHGMFLVLEMFLWDKPLGLQIFHQTPEQAKTTKTLAANQGLYNGFLAAGLFWGLSQGPEGTPVRIFFLTCVLLAGLFGAATASRSILWIQALPAAIALVATLLVR